MFEAKVRAKIVRAAKLLREAERPLRVLRTVSWPADTSAKFFASGATAMPKVTYEPIDPRPTRELVEEARREIDGHSDVHDWLHETARILELTADMLAGVGTKRFFERSRDLYLEPNTPLLDGVTTSLDLANALTGVLDSFSLRDLVAGEVEILDAEQLAARMRPLLVRYLGEAAPSVVVVDHLSAKALAGGREVKIRRDAEFTDRDVASLLHHEALIHIATTLNGVRQTELPILAASHPGTTMTQEGLAVFAEFFTGSMEPNRLRRLADRVIAIQMAINGADFMELYRYFVEATGDEKEAFESARRIVRGGLMTGGGPFTKDGVYLDGLLRVHNFLRSIVHYGRTDLLRLLFCGKLNLEQVPMLSHLAKEGLCVPPKFLPPWVSDLRFLVSYLAYSSFLNTVQLADVKAHYRELIGSVPPPRDDDLTNADSSHDLE